MTLAGNSVCMPRDLDLCPFDPKISGFTGLIVDHFYVKFGNPSCIDL